LIEESAKKETRYREIAGILILLFSLILFLSLGSFGPRDEELLLQNRPVQNLIGPFGAWLAGHLRAALGLSAYIAAALFGLAGWEVMRRGGVSHATERLFALFYLAIVSSALIALLARGAAPQAGGGFAGVYMVRFLESFMSATGAALVVVIFNVIGLILLGLLSMTAVVESARSKDNPLARGAGAAWRKISSLRRRDKAPMNNIEEAIRKRNSGKLPWITKKTVTIHGTSYERREVADAGPVKLLSMQNPVYTGKDDFVYNDYRSAEDSLFNRGYAELAREESKFAAPREMADTVPAEEYGLLEEFEARDARGVRDAIPAGETVMEPRQGRPRITSIERDAEDAVIVAEGETCAEDAKEEHVYDLDGETDDADGAPEGIAVAGDGGGDDDAGDGTRVFEDIPISKDYIIPVRYLNSSAPADAELFRSEIRRNSELLVNTLNEFGIESRVVKVNRGPVITLYEMQIAPGIKVNRIVGLSDDIALALAASRVRIVAPIPGKSAVGVEVPNLNREMVTLGDIIKSPEYSLIQGKLKVALGKDILGNPVTLDLKKLPHLLIAGATGSGKSVCVNSIIQSLIYNCEPNHVRFIMVDPKMVELQLYNGLAHLLTPVITEPHVAPRALKWATMEMERRYRLLSAMNTRDIDRYNEKVESMKGEYEKLPYIVIIMDELADLMMIAAKEIEGFITRIAQKARAVGIHLVLATQRPSVDVITGIIKANFPARIAFQVAQKTDSRTILDQNGAEKLLGKGDMLYQSPMSSFPVRVQGAFISEDEVLSIVQHLRKLAQPRYIDIEEDLYTEEDEDDDMGGESDELFREALKIVEETKKASASYLQRRLSIGYNRAARMIELMEEKGLVGPQQGSKPREVFL